MDVPITDLGMAFDTILKFELGPTQSQKLARGGGGCSSVYLAISLVDGGSRHTSSSRLDI